MNQNKTKSSKTAGLSDIEKDNRRLVRREELVAVAAKVEAINALTVSGGGLQLKKADKNWMLIAPDSAGLPTGYEAKSVILCENGAPVTGTILFKASEA